MSTSWPSAAISVELEALPTSVHAVPSERSRVDHGHRIRCGPQRLSVTTPMTARR
jgi:hypothetical protein